MAARNVERRLCHTSSQMSAGSRLSTGMWCCAAARLLRCALLPIRRNFNAVHGSVVVREQQRECRRHRRGDKPVLGEERETRHSSVLHSYTCPARLNVMP